MYKVKGIHPKTGTIVFIFASALMLIGSLPRVSHYDEVAGNPCAGYVVKELGWPLVFYWERTPNCYLPSWSFPFFFIPFDYLVCVLIVVVAYKLLKYFKAKR